MAPEIELLEQRFEDLEMQLDRHLDRCPACGFELCETAKQLNKEMDAVEDRLRDQGWEVPALSNVTVRRGWE